MGSKFDWWGIKEWYTIELPLLPEVGEFIWFAIQKDSKCHGWQRIFTW